MRYVPVVFALIISFGTRAQGYPWERPLLVAWSSDGLTFEPPTLFQDSSGVPSVVRWHGDTLIAAFQWFRQPDPSPSWDRVAVKFSYDNGASWTGPSPIVVNGLPSDYQRPFDPTLTAIGGDSLRIYYSSSDGMPPPLLDSTVNTYSAVSADGVHYQFEPGARVDVVENRVIDPAVIHFGPGWHYLAPAGAPQDGAFHYVSPNGIDFTPVPMIPSDAMHNWTGNYMVESPGELRFYGAGQNGIWYNSTPNGGVWNGYMNTNVHGGDPSVLKAGDGSYLMVYVGATYSTGISVHAANQGATVLPVPAQEQLRILNGAGVVRYRIISIAGALLQEGQPLDGTIVLQYIPSGAYVIALIDRNGWTVRSRIIKE